jgi:hypothetical protein
MRFLLAAGLLCVAGQALAGAWGAGSFDNDDALDWAQNFEASPSMDLVASSLKRVIGAGYVEAPEGSAAIAGAEAIAAAIGKPSATLPAGLAAWAFKQSKPEAQAQLPLARQAVARVARGERSELRELWSESNIGAWQAAVADLEKRLSE